MWLRPCRLFRLSDGAATRVQRIKNAGSAIAGRNAHRGVEPAVEPGKTGCLAEINRRWYADGRGDHRRTGDTPMTLASLGLRCFTVLYAVAAISVIVDTARADHFR